MFDGDKVNYIGNIPHAFVKQIAMDKYKGYDFVGMYCISYSYSYIYILYIYSMYTVYSIYIYSMYTVYVLYICIYTIKLWNGEVFFNKLNESFVYQGSFITCSNTI
jgi:hypothetical protein